MLDAYIIDRIRREKERARKDRQIPLRIEVPRRPPESEPMSERDDADRGSVKIDYAV